MLLAEAAAAIGAEYLESGGLYSTDKPLSASGLKRLIGFNMNATSSYSPVVLNNNWPAVWRLAIITGLASVGTLLNVFYIASFFVQKSLKKLGNVYLGCLGFADVVITSGVMPVAGVVLIAKVQETSPVCYLLQFLTVGATYAYSLLFLMIAIENNIRLCRTRACYRKFLSIPGFYVSFMIFVVSYIASGVGVYYGLNYDYCNRKSFGDFTFRLLTLIFFYGIPFACIIILLVWAWLVIRDRSKRLVRFKRARRYKRDFTFTSINLVAYSTFVTAWLPYMIVVNKFPNTDDGNYYTVVWVGLSRSILTTLIYCAISSDFRKAYVKLFYYCFCKNSLTISNNRRHRRTIVTQPKTGGINMQALQNIQSCPEVSTLAAPVVDIQTSSV